MRVRVRRVRVAGEGKSNENRLTYPLKKRQIDLLVSTLAYSAIGHVDLEARKEKPKTVFEKKREIEDVMQIMN